MVLLSRRAKHHMRLAEQQRCVHEVMRHIALLDCLCICFSCSPIQPLMTIPRERLRPIALQGYSRVVLIGHSYGCYLVNRLASTEEAREKVAAVALIGAGYPVAGYNYLRWIFYLPLFVSSLCLL